MIKRMLRHAGARTFTALTAKRINKVIVASTGRAGSNMLFNAVSQGFIRSNTNRLGRKFPKLAFHCIAEFNSRLDELHPGPPYVIKTHDYRPDRTWPSVKFIFVFGDPLESIMSAEQVTLDKGLEWFERHQFNLRAVGDFEERYFRDVLNYEGQIVSWLASDRKDVLVVSYDDLWHRTNEIEKFLGFPVLLPDRRERSNKTPPRYYDKDLFIRLADLANRLYENYRTSLS